MEQTASGMRFDELCPAIAINILDFPFLSYNEYHNRYRLKNTTNNDQLTDVFEINFIELGEELEMLENQDPILEKAVNKLLYVSADEKLRYELEMREKAEMDYWSAMGTNYEKGVQAGIQQGVRESILCIAKNLLDAGDSVEKIVKITGLTRDEVEKLYKESMETVV